MMQENWKAVDEATKLKVRRSRERVELTRLQYEDMVRKEKMALGQDDST